MFIIINITERGKLLNKVILGGYFIILISIIGLYIINKYTIRILSKKISDEKIHKTQEQIRYVISKFFRENNIENIKISFSEVYCFNLQSKTLNIKNIQNYTLYDEFICYHEVGHVIDYSDKYTNIYTIMTKLRILFYILWGPILCCGIINIIKEKRISQNIYIVIFILLIVAIINICVTIFMEKRASNFAINNICVSKEKLIFLKKLIRYSILDQILVYLMFILPLILTLII